MAKKALPKKLSTLIRLAVEDVKQVAKNRKYILNLDTWHDPITVEDTQDEELAARRADYQQALAKVAPKAKIAPGKCMVCFAGSTIANRMGCSPDEMVEPDTFGDNNNSALYALNEIREGGIYYAAMHMSERTDISPKTREKYKNIMRGAEAEKYRGREYKGFDLMDGATRKKFYKDMEEIAKFFEERGV